MSDVLDNERGPAPMWVVPVAILAVVVLVVALAWRWSGSDDDTTARPVVSFSATTPTPAPLPSPSMAGNACGGDVEQPLIDAAPAPPGTGLRILVGDRDLRLLDVDAGTAKVLSARTDRRAFTVLAQTANEVLTVLRDPCSPAGYGTGEVDVVDPGTGALTSRGRGDEILPGEPVTVAQFDQDGAIRLRELGSQATTRVVPGWIAHARTSRGYYASVVRNGFDSGVAPAVGFGVPTEDTLIRTDGVGTVIGASPNSLFWLAGDCPGPECMLHWTSPSGTTHAVPAAGGYACCGAVSADGLSIAFRMSRPNGRFGAHPGPPQDIAVLDTATAGPGIHVLKGVVLPAKANVTLTWSPDSQWLVIGVDLGTGPAVLVWREGMERPAQVPIPPTGGGTTGAPSLVVLPR